LIPIPYSYRAPESYVETNLKGTLNLCQAALKGVYGPRQSARAVIPTIISQIAAGAKEVKLGNLTTTRDFTFVDDMCRGLLAVATLDSGLGEVFNIGSDQEISMGESFSDRALL
jgi:nucleoside-diphosphate-sugar epimerase